MNHLIPLVLFLLSSCRVSTQEHDFHYHFSKATTEFEMPKKLAEVSGLTYLGNKRIACLNDEEGKVYHLNYEEQTLEKAIDFKDKGDFEGIAFDGIYSYALKSKGTIYQLDSTGIVKTFKPFENKLELEGLCYLKARNSLLIACKKQESIKKDQFIWVYEFDLDKEDLTEKAFLKIKKEGSLAHFRPSGVAIHPEGNLFLISGVSNSIIEIDENHSVKNLHQFSKKDFPQIEGITFDEQGGIYLATEKNKLPKSKVVYFKYHE